jgi:S1-C subfamily serine protease
VQLLEPSPAAAAGLHVGDIVVELDGHPIEGVGDLQRRLGGDLIGRSVDLRVDRAGESRSVAVSPVELAE